MSKVVHLSNDSHAEAKLYCKARGLKMSDWVGALIMAAVSEAAEPKEPEPVPEVSMPRKKKLPRSDDTIQMSEDGVPVYSQPPFWARVDSHSEETEEAGDMPAPTLEAAAPAAQPEAGTMDTGVNPGVAGIDTERTEF